MVTPAVADDAVLARRQVEATRLLQVHVASLAVDIAGFNRRNATCSRDEAATVAAYDATHQASFTRTIGWRWDADRSRWVTAALDKAGVKLAYKGAPYSGTLTVAGREDAVCRAEASQELEAWARYPRDGNESSWVGDSVALPKLAALLSARTGDALDVSAPTPRAERQARIAKAQSLLDAEATRLEARAATGKTPSDCPAATTHAGNGPFMTWSRNLGHDGAHGAWVHSESALADAPLETRTAWDGKTIIADKCLAFRPVILTARATWRNEGENVLLFRLQLPRRPVTTQAAPQHEERDDGR